MKILSLNTHSLLEENQIEKCKQTALFIHENQPDIIALQEVNQSICAKSCGNDKYYRGEAQLKEDNYASALVNKLNALGSNYLWTWIPIKIGYGKYEEGLALLSKTPMFSQEEILLTSIDDFSNWKTRKALVVQTRINHEMVWIYNVHMGWWNDDESFSYQWDQLKDDIAMKSGKIYIIGDFNAPDCIKNQSYDQIKNDGYYDTYQLAKNVIGHSTTKGKIDGWKDVESEMRIDYIFSNQKVNVIRHEVVFNSISSPIVSDHYGILMEEK